jgi:hypothetical protein
LFSQKIGFALLGLKKNRAGIGRRAHASLEVSGGARVASQAVKRSIGQCAAELCPDTIQRGCVVA